jgi:heptosyltransferase-2
MRYLVVQTAFLGDAVLTLPLLSVLRRSGGSNWIGVVASPPGAEFLRKQGVADSVVEYDKRGVDRGLSAYRRLISKIRELEIDVALIPHRSFRSALLPALAGVPVRTGFDKSGGRLFLTDVVKYRSRDHEVERVVALAEPVGLALESGRVPFDVRVPPGEADALGAVLSERGIEAGRALVAISPGSRWPTKRWLPDRFAGVARALSGERGMTAVIVGSDADREIGAAVSASAGSDVVDLTGRLGLGEWVALLDRAELLISNDSAAVHVAAGVGTPVVAIFGPTVEGQGFAPYIDRAVIVGVDLPCRPCGRHGGDRCRLGTHACMTGISESDVFNAANLLLGGPRL